MNIIATTTTKREKRRGRKSKMNQSASAQNLVGSQKNLTSSLPMSETPNQDARRNPIDVYTARRRSVRRQKHELVESKLSQFPTGFLIFHCFVLVGIAALYFAVQIALLVRQSPLSIICTGFWMALLYLACIYTVFLLGIQNFLVHINHHI